MRRIILVIGVLALLMGLLWIGQGTGAVPWPAQSFMINQMPWTYRGIGLAISGLIAIFIFRGGFGANPEVRARMAAGKRTTTERVYSRSEYLADAVIHILGAIGAVIGSLALLLNVPGRSAATIAVYCAGLLAMLAASAAYNLTPAKHRSKEALRRLDHAVIYIMIAATYTPFAVYRLVAPAGDIILGAVWVAAAIGVVIKTVFPQGLEVLSSVLYLAMGWMAVPVIGPFFAAMSPLGFWLLLAGGIVYSLGVPFHLLERVPFNKVIWHSFVLVAAGLQFAAIAVEFTA